MDETEFNCLGSLHFTPEEINLIFKEHSSDVVIHQSQFFHFMTEAMKNSGDAAELILTKITLFIHQYHHKLTTKEIEDLVATLNETNFDLFWQFLIELLNQHGIAVFEQPHNLISSIIDSNLIQFPGTFQIIFIKTFFLCFFIENRVIEIGNSTDNFLFVKMDDDAFNLVFNALMKCNTVEKSEILIDFIMTLIHKNTFEFDFLNQYFIQGILRFIGQNNVSWIILQLLVKFIDAIEGRVDLTRFGREIFQIPRKYQTIRIYFPNKDSIDLNIKVKNTSLSALRNIISSITHSPLDSICFNVNSLENTKTICFELKNINTHLHSASFENFPSVFISNSDIYGFIMLNIQNDQAGPFCLKLLHRLKKAPSDFLQDSPEYFAEVLYKDDLSPYLYQYFTEHLEHLLQHRESENGNIGNYEIIIQILFNLLISLKFPMKNQKTCLRILRKYFNTSLSEESVVSLLAVFCEEPCNEDLLLFISKYLPENGINLNDISIARNLIMNTTNVIGCPVM
ncbi:hypothetical protein TRFO_11890 [Tritrichomonas foetus]|uniref:Uncharacterized protein n=1 Tax=Tritrichomonas foetus TaxID=1144522 RepID=A0A1J4J0Z4_9EUKA|nr:hypothetical protein TRFO_11890 [Tritrichomonas foetus]|eukprot:OHS93278.1 hypothetical protein TRFO_11890 [Tritrichomonas foetus]